MQALVISPSPDHFAEPDRPTSPGRAGDVPRQAKDPLIGEQGEKHGLLGILVDAEFRPAADRNGLEGLAELAHERQVVHPTSGDHDLAQGAIGEPLGPGGGDAARDKGRQRRQDVHQSEMTVAREEILNPGLAELLSSGGLRRRGQDVGMREEALHQDGLDSPHGGHSTVQIAAAVRTAQASGDEVERQIRGTGIEGPEVLDVLAHPAEVGHAPEIEGERPGSRAEEEIVQHGHQWGPLAAGREIADAEIPHHRTADAFGDDRDLPDLQRLPVFPRTPRRPVEDGQSVRTDEIRPHATPLPLQDRGGRGREVLAQDPVKLGQFGESQIEHAAQAFAESGGKGNLPVGEETQLSAAPEALDLDEGGINAVQRGAGVQPDDVAGGFIAD
jgi:hypothetical protein